MEVIHTMLLNRRDNATFRDHIWPQFLEYGSNHSASGSFLTHIIAKCEEEKIPYCLTAMPGTGYFIEQMPVSMSAEMRAPCPKSSDGAHEFMDTAHCYHCGVSR